MDALVQLTSKRPLLDVRKEPAKPDPYVDALVRAGPVARGTARFGTPGPGLSPPVQT